MSCKDLPGAIHFMRPYFGSKTACGRGLALVGRTTEAIDEVTCQTCKYSRRFRAANDRDGLGLLEWRMERLTRGMTPRSGGQEGLRRMTIGELRMGWEQLAVEVDQWAETHEPNKEDKRDMESGQLTRIERLASATIDATSAQLQLSLGQ